MPFLFTHLSFFFTSNVLGKAATKIHPGEGMPIFKQSSSDNLNNLKPKMVFRRIKTMVAKNKKRLATL